MRTLQESILDDEQTIDNNLNNEAKLLQFLHDIYNADGDKIMTSNVMKKYSLAATLTELDSYAKHLNQISQNNIIYNILVKEYVGYPKTVNPAYDTVKFYTIGVVAETAKDQTTICEFSFRIIGKSIIIRLELMTKLKSEHIDKLGFDLIKDFQKTAMYKRVLKFAKDCKFEISREKDPDYGTTILMYRKLS